jgi:hypothetical protein
MAVDKVLKPTGFVRWARGVALKPQGQREPQGWHAAMSFSPTLGAPEQGEEEPGGRRGQGQHPPFCIAQGAYPSGRSWVNRRMRPQGLR